jgi:CHAT domain-containing protein
VHGFRPLTAGEIQNSVIERGSLLIEYCLGREASYAWLVGHDSIGSVRLPPRQIIEAAVRRYLSALQARADSGDAGNESRAARLRAADDALPAAAAALYRMLVAPFAARLGQARLLLVTDGILNTMPIEALPADNGEPLLAGREIVRLPAASLSPLLRSASPAPPGVRTTVAIVADPEPTGPSDLPPLRFSRAEAESIAAAMPTAKLALGRDAALARLRSPDFRQAAILHFATHVAIDDAHPARSGLVLSNGILRPDDISGLGLAARTVVLSGCRTALGEPLRGEGLIGMTRAFLLAGASRVIASLWDVQDQATARLMGEFYSGLLVRKLAPAAALRSAQLSLRSDPRFSHPYYWAGFILTGDWKP